MMYAIFNNQFVVTCNDDGTIPLNAVIVCDVPKGGAAQDALEEMIKRANYYSVPIFDSIESIKRVMGDWVPSANDKIAWIRELRARTGCSLFEGKKAVELRMQKTA